MTAPVAGDFESSSTGEDSVDQLPSWVRSELPTGVPADVTRIQRYGFEIYQDPAKPLVWDFDALRLGSNALCDEMGANNFVIRGSLLSQFRNEIGLFRVIYAAFGGATFNPVEFFSFLGTLAEPGIEAVIEEGRGEDRYDESGNDRDQAEQHDQPRVELGTGLAAAPGDF